MGVTSEVLGTHGPGHALTHNGKVYRLSHITQSVKAAWEQRLFDRDMAPILAMKPHRSAQHTNARLDEIEAKFRNGDYELLSKAGGEALRTLFGMRTLLSLLIGCDDSELTALLLAKKDELVRLVSLVINESFPGMELAPAAENADPNV